MVRLIIAILVVIGLVITAGRRKRHDDSSQTTPPGKTPRRHDMPGEEGSGDRPPLDPPDPELSGGAAKRLGDDN